MTQAYKVNKPSLLSREDFLKVFGAIYEHSLWIAEQSWDQGLGIDHDTPRGLHSALVDTIERAGHGPKLALLRAHPDLAGKLAVGEKLTYESTGEQQGAGLDQCTPEEFTEFQNLNDHYKEKFGFPFILAVKGHDRHSILEAFRRRAGGGKSVV